MARPLGRSLRPTLPLPEGERIVEIEMRNAAVTGRASACCTISSSGGRTSVSSKISARIGTSSGTCSLGDARPEPVTVAEISASAFRVTRVPPLLGRPLLDSDEQPGRSPVVVIGYDVWQAPWRAHDVVGQTVRLGKAATTTIVGVMPEGFAFPVNHRFWMPLQLRPAGYEPLEGAAISVFGRVAPDATQAQAGAEVAALAERAAAAFPADPQHLRPRVLAYGGENPGDRGD